MLEMEREKRTFTRKHKFKVVNTIFRASKQSAMTLDTSFKNRVASKNMHGRYQWDSRKAMVNVFGGNLKDRNKTYNIITELLILYGEIQP